MCEEIRPVFSRFEYRFKEKHPDKEIVYESQKKVADDITKAYEQGVVAVTLCAPCQWGKTGAMYQIIKNMTTKQCDIEKCIPYENIYILTGLSSTEWKTQTIERFPKQFENNILHLDDIRKQLPLRMTKCTDALFIIDECHIANQSKQTFDETFKKMQINDIDYMKNNNIKILQVSATPDNAVFEMRSWHDNHKIFIPEIPDSYVSFEKLFNWGRVFSKLDLRKLEDLNKFFDHIIVNFEEPKFHILRINAKHDIRGDIHVKAKHHGIKIVNHDCSDKIEKIEELLSKPPEVHTLIIIKQMWKAAKTLQDTNIGVVHESLALSKNFSTEVQGLPGRLCGHGKIQGDGVGPHLFCSTKILEEYIKLLDTKFDYKGIYWRSGNLKSNGNGAVKSITTMFSPSSMRGISPVYLAPVLGKNYTHKTEIAKYEDFKNRWSLEKFLIKVKKETQAKSRFKFTKDNMDENGFYKCSVTQSKQVFTWSELNERLKGMSHHANLGINFTANKYILQPNEKHTRMYVCYDDLTPASVNNPIIVVRTFETITICDFSEK